MAPRLLKTLISLTLLNPLTTACPPLNTTDTDSLAKRSYGVQIHKDPAGNLLAPGPWPVIPGLNGIQPLRYCFAEQSDYDSLNPILLAAIELWKPAMTPNTALDIIPDNGQEPCICGTEGVRGDALNLRDYTRARVTACKVGWDPKVKGAENGQWHELRYARVDTQLDGQGRPVKVGERDVVRMAHEIGHALGLEHEHQRPDAAKFIEFDCTALDGYAQMKKDITSGKVEGYQKGDTIEKACTDLPTALRLGWTEVTQRLPFPSPGTPAPIGTYTTSSTLDFSSIMLYSSFDGHIAGVDPNRFDEKGTGAVLKKFEEKKSKIPGRKGKRSYERVSMGGKWPARNVARVGEGDVEWVRGMYPKQG